jgi:3-hydroxybutyryl-CoA dehydrogenase
MTTTVAVIGGGTMGTGIAYVSALAGFPVTVVEPDDNGAARMQGVLESAAQNGVKRGRLEQAAAQALLQRIGREKAVEAIAEGTDLVIETVPERLELKCDILRRIAARKPGLIGSNTSALSIDRLAQAVDDPEQFLGMHFFNPVWSIKLVELIRGSLTTEASIERARAFARTLGKESLVVRDVPGFATSRLDLVSSLEAMRMLESGVASADDIDRAAVLAYGHPIGPLRLSDIVGLDVRLDISRVLEAAHGERFAPPQLLMDMVGRGDLGQKTGRGFYTWED